MARLLGRFSDVAYAALRIVIALLFLCHGLQKLIGAFGGHAVPVASLFGAAAIIESVAGALIAVGLFTPCAAFVASGEMAVAYFTQHAPKGPLPVQNGGDLAVAFCFVFLYISTRGGGRFSLDALFGTKKTRR
jgi:putative oxidoreductase